jgi:hypothetical protein
MDHLLGKVCRVPEPERIKTRMLKQSREAKV